MVIAADQQVTHGAAGMQTVGQPTTKIQALKEQALYASSGHVGIGQQLSAAIENLLDKFSKQEYSRISGSIKSELRQILKPALETAGVARQAVGGGAAMDAICTGLLAANFKDGPKLIDINMQGELEYLTPAVPFVCHGSGKFNADPLLRFLWNVYWRDKRPTLREGVLAGYWTVKAVIELKTQGVGFEPDVFVVESGVARQIENGKLREHDEFIRAVEHAMRSVRDTMLAGATTQAAPVEAPPPPPPPAATGA